MFFESNYVRIVESKKIRSKFSIKNQEKRKKKSLQTKRETEMIESHCLSWKLMLVEEEFYFKAANFFCQLQ